MRLDKFLVSKGVAKTRSKAIQLIKLGKVMVNGKVEYKQSKNIAEHDSVEVLDQFRYVSRGGYKIEGFLSKAGIQIENKVVLDVGCSAGGFTNFFLTKGAKMVYALDISQKVLDLSLRNHPKVKFFGGVDVRDSKLLKALFKERKFDIVSIDVSNLPLEEVLSSIIDFVDLKGFVVALFKPPYEGGKGFSDEEIKSLTSTFERKIESSFEILLKDFSPLRGGTKNKGIKEVFYLLLPR